MKAGDKVMCLYRIPSTIQYWLVPAYVGTIQEATATVAEWNGRNSQREYYNNAGLEMVAYAGLPGTDCLGFSQEDAVDSLFQPPPGWDTTRRVESQEEVEFLWDWATARCPRMAGRRQELVKFANLVTAGGTGGSPLSLFAKTAIVEDKWREVAVQVALNVAKRGLAVYEGRMSSMDATTKRNIDEARRLAGLIKQAPAGVRLVP